VEREGQKAILIGRRGAAIKTIGTQARKELESILDIHIFLELFVKVQPNWRDNSSMVRQLDWHRQLEQLGEYQNNEADEEGDPADDDDEDDKAPKDLEL
jgi:GTP-binding protein Era